MRAHISAILLISIIPCFALAQSEPIASLERGAKIRLAAATIPESERIGKLDSVSPDSIHFRPDSHPITRSLSLKNVTTLEVRRETGSRKGDYALIGAIAGGILGYISSNHNGQGLGTGKASSGQNAVVGGLAGLTIGGGLGYWYGGKKKVAAWRPVDR
jgi:hypothetical protein